MKSVEPVKPLAPPDSLHLQAAQGWCELHAFADAELDNIASSLRAHPKVLEVRWQIYANLEKWAGALDIASAIVKLVPDWPSGWIYRASSLTELNRQQEAYETLSEAAARLLPRCAEALPGDAGRKDQGDRLRDRHGRSQRP